MFVRITLSLVLGLSPIPAAAEGWSLADGGAEFRRIDDRAKFVELVGDGELTRFGVAVKVEPDGQIRGRALGRSISGAWDWRGGYFCRDLFWGSRELGTNCQSVAVSGQIVRFTSDEGRGPFADLKLE
jgi:hypothetical protein